MKLLHKPRFRNQTGLQLASCIDALSAIRLVYELAQRLWQHEWPWGTRVQRMMFNALLTLLVVGDISSSRCRRNKTDRSFLS